MKLSCALVLTWALIAEQDAYTGRWVSTALAMVMVALYAFQAGRLSRG